MQFNNIWILRSNKQQRTALSVYTMPDKKIFIVQVSKLLKNWITKIKVIDRLTTTTDITSSPCHIIVGDPTKDVTASSDNQESITLHEFQHN